MVEGNKLVPQDDTKDTSLAILRNKKCSYLFKRRFFFFFF